MIAFTVTDDGRSLINTAVAGTSPLIITGVSFYNGSTKIKTIKSTLKGCSYNDGNGIGEYVRIFVEDLSTDTYSVTHIGLLHNTILVAKSSSLFFSKNVKPFLIELSCVFSGASKCSFTNIIISLPYATKFREGILRLAQEDETQKQFSVYNASTVDSKIEDLKYLLSDGVVEWKKINSSYITGTLQLDHIELCNDIHSVTSTAHLYIEGKDDNITRINVDGHLVGEVVSSQPSFTNVGIIGSNKLVNEEYILNLYSNNISSSNKQKLVSSKAVQDYVTTSISEIDLTPYLTRIDAQNTYQLKGNYVLASSLGDAAYKGVDTSISSSSTNNNVPTSLAVYSYIDAQGFLTQHQSLAGCVASGEYDSTNHNILLKNSSGTVLSIIDATAFIKDGMVDTVTISNNNLVITFNTDAGKQPISISLNSIFDSSNYYTKSQVDSGFVTTSTNQLALTGNKAWLHDSSTPEATIEEKAYVTGGATPSMGVEKSATSTTYVDDPTLIQEAKLELGTMSVQSSSYTYEEYPLDEEDPDSDPSYFESSHDVKSVTIDANWRKIEVFHEHQVSTYDEEQQVVIDYTTSGKTTINAGNITTYSHSSECDTQTSFSGNGIQINRTGNLDYTSDDYDISLSDAGLDIQLAQDSDKYVRVSVGNGLEVKNGSSHVYTRVNDLGIQRGGTLYMWDSIPLHFAPNYNALSVTTHGSSASTQYVPKHFITQVHFKDNGNGLSCAYQQNSFSGRGRWSPYITCEDAVITVIDSTLKLVFGGEDIESIRITMPSTHGGVCNFKILIPKSGSYVTIQGTIYADASSSADYVLSTPLSLNSNDLIIIDAQFTPTFFIPVPNNA